MMAKQTISLTVNTQSAVVEVEPGKTLLRVLREDMGLTSAKEGCGQGDCGSCVVVMDGKSVNSCLVLAGQAQGSQVVTLEGLEQNGQLHPLQEHFAKEWGFQCGYCTSGMLMSCYDLLNHNSQPSREEITEAISGNLCRCTNYRAIIDAVEIAAAELHKSEQG
ncbi:MAG: carbon-monoxide dehydrogenase small subunit [Porticoccaceae bacterium]|jgi:carbon-monoxide dehydrogenase small subunit|tara:strand:+ start:3428 stop:3916 length:489 start_codon:yes stop_codon:yes gene_type:complete